MQAIILAGGYGTRLYPLTLNAPKPMVPVGGRPIVDYIVEKIDHLKICSEIFIVTNAKFANVFEKWKEEKNRDDIIIVNDGTTAPENRLGSLGDIQFVIDNYHIYQDVLILGGDNFFEDTLTEIIHMFQKKGNTIAMYDTGNKETIKQLSNVIIDENQKIQSFIEKPEKPISSICATLIYCLKNQTLKHIISVIKSGKSDRAGDLIAYICSIEPIFGYTLEGKWFDIGSMSQLEEAEEWLKAKNSSISQV